MIVFIVYLSRRGYAEYLILDIFKRHYGDNETIVLLIDGFESYCGNFSSSYWSAFLFGLRNIAERMIYVITTKSVNSLHPTIQHQIGSDLMLVRLKEPSFQKRLDIFMGLFESIKDDCRLKDVCQISTHHPEAAILLAMKMQVNSLL